jgi:putative endonuclease
MQRTLYWVSKLRRTLLESAQKAYPGSKSAGISLGAQGELLAEKFLRKSGIRIVERSYREHYGEIDLIGVDNRTLVFIEVKTRTSDFAGDPTSAVDVQKQRKIVRTALAYMRHHDLLEESSRFDVVSILLSHGDATDNTPQIKHYKNAFEPAETGQMFA